jgi:hypothetical protein
LDTVFLSDQNNFGRLLGRAVVEEFLDQLGADASRITGEKCDGGMSHIKI